MTVPGALPADDARRVRLAPGGISAVPQPARSGSLVCEPPWGSPVPDRVGARGVIAPGTIRRVPGLAVLAVAGAVAVGSALGAVLSSASGLGRGSVPVPTRTVYLDAVPTQAPSPVVVVTSIAVIPGKPETITVSAP